MRDVHDAYVTGFRYLEQKEFDKALEEFDRAFNLNPQNEHVHHGLGLCYQYKKQLGRARDEFLESVRINPQNEHVHQSLGFCYKDLKQFDDAIREFKEVLEINPENENSYIGFGFCYLDQRQANEALAEFNKALKMNPQNEHAYLGIGSCYKQQKQFDKAIAAFKETLRINPDNEHAHNDLGCCYESLKLFDKAVEEFKEAIRINPGNEYYHHGLGRSYEGVRQFDKAIYEFGEILKVNPDNKHAVPCIVSCCKGLKQQGKDINEIRVIAAGPGNNNASVHYGLGIFCLEQEDFSGAITEFSRALEIEPRNIKYILGSGISYFKQKRYKEASKIFYEALEIEPDNSEVLKYLKEIERPDFCVIEVTHRCMFQCRMCNYWQTKSGVDSDEISIEDLRKFILSLKDFVSTPFGINISGGEPLLREGMLDLIEFIAEQGFKFSMVTNGYLINKAVAKRIADSGLNFIAISLDSLDEKIHDNLRGIKGAHRKVMDALGYFDAYKGKLENLTVQTIIMGPNMDGILDLAEWARDKKFSLSFMAVTRPNMVPVDVEWYKKKEFSFLWPQDTAKAHYVLGGLIKLKKAGYRIDNPVGQLERFKLYFSDPERFIKETSCSLGDDIMQVNPRGDVYLCCEMEPTGNIKEGDIGKIWTSKKAESIREKIRSCQRNCASMVNCYREA